jgi:hypothetical protein
MPPKKLAAILALAAPLQSLALNFPQTNADLRRPEPGDRNRSLDRGLNFSEVAIR